MGTAFIFHSWRTPTLNGITELKIRESYQLISKEYLGYLYSASFRDRPELSSICPTGMAHIFMNKMQELKAKFNQQKVNI